MTNTISVPIRLLERVLDECNRQVAWDAQDELRAILAQPAHDVASVQDSFERYRLADKFCEQRLIGDDSPLRSAPVEPVANQLIKGMADALRHALKELDTETPEDIDYGQLYSALSAYEAFKVEPAHSDDARDALVEALEVLAKLGNGEHYGNSDGNVIAQRALTAYRAAMGSK